MVKTPMLCAAIITHWLIALPGFPIISGVSGIVNVLCLIKPAVLVYLFWVL
jgi:hypothetical protein